jgi:hypothetical protein
MRCDQIPRLFQLEWQHRLIYHVTHLVGSVSVVFKQFLSNRINEVFQFAQEENLRLIADLGEIVKIKIPLPPLMLFVGVASSHDKIAARCRSHKT